MWSVQIVVDPPVFDDLPRMAITAEQMLVEAFIAQTAVERFHEAILHGLSRRDVVPVDANNLVAI